MIKVALTQQQYDAKAAELATQGVHLTGNSGQVEHSGVAIAYTYQGGELTLQVTHKPVLMPMAAIEARLRGWLGVAA